MVDHHQTYSQQADEYEELVSHEDYQGNLLPAIRKILPLEGKDVIELGAGTGRLTLLMAPHVKSLQAFDLSAHMLKIAGQRLEATGLENWRTAVADHRDLPAFDQCADLVIGGWTVAYLVDWYRETWKAELEKAFAEMRRVLRPGSTVIIIETMGTGFETPHPPEHLLEYYAYLREQGFSETWIRTDYRFESLEQSARLAKFFFGEALANEVVEKGWSILPECTGLWWKKLD